VYGEHRRREIRPRSRFIEVPKIEGRRLAGVSKHFCLKAPAIRGVCWLGSSIDPAIEHSE
jgi:hypothetical protein